MVMMMVDPAWGFEEQKRREKDTGGEFSRETTSEYHSEMEIGYWILLLEIGNWKLEIGNWKRETMKHKC